MLWSGSELAVLAAPAVCFIFTCNCTSSVSAPFFPFFVWFFFLRFLIIIYSEIALLYWISDGKKKGGSRGTIWGEGGCAWCRWNPPCKWRAAMGQTCGRRPWPWGAATRLPQTSNSRVLKQTLSLCHVLLGLCYCLCYSILGLSEAAIVELPKPYFDLWNVCKEERGQSQCRAHENKEQKSLEVAEKVVLYFGDTLVWWDSFLWAWWCSTCYIVHFWSLFEVYGSRWFLLLASYFLRLLIATYHYFYTGCPYELTKKMRNTFWWKTSFTLDLFRLKML